MTEHESRVRPTRRRLGPVSTICRLVLTAVVVWSAVNWTRAGVSGFSRSSMSTDFGIWLLIGLGIYYGVYATAAGGFGRRWGIRTVAAFAIVLVGAGSAAFAAQETLWAAPLTWLLFGLVLWFFVLTAIAGPVSLALATPGCEFGALGEAIRRLRGASVPERDQPMFCIIGLHKIDEWEARRSASS